MHYLVARMATLLFYFTGEILMKKFSNINQQINILKSRGMKFTNVSFAKDILMLKIY